MKRTLATVALLAWSAGLALTPALAQQVSLDSAIRNAAEDLSAGIGRGNRVAVIAMESDSGGMSGYLVSEMIHALVRLQSGRGFTVMDRAQLDLLLDQLEFDMSDFVDNNTAQRVGRFMGVQFVVVGDFEPVGGFFRFRARVIEVETAAIRGSYAASVQNDEIIASLRGATPPAQQPGSQAPGRASGEVRAILMTDAAGIDDRSFNAAAWRGMLAFYGETLCNTPGRGSLFNVLSARSRDFYVPNLRNAVDEGFNLIIAAGFDWADSLELVAALHPEQNFLLVDADWVNLPNVMQAVFAEHQGAFLVGAAAALQAIGEGIENPRFGFIGGIPGAIITRYHVGFVQGVLSVIPGAEVLEFYVNSWAQPALARAQAMNWYNDGVFAVFSAAGASGNGTIAEAREQRLRGNNVWAIGVDSCQFELGMYGNNSAVLTSMIKRVETAVIHALNAVRNGTFTGRTIMFDLSMNGVGFSTYNPALSPMVISRLNQIRQRIISGEIVVASTLAEAMRIPGFPQNLLAVDGW